MFYVFRYQFIRYEDLISSPLKTLYSSFEFAFGDKYFKKEEIEEIAKKHFPAQFDINSKASNSYYSTVRNGDFDANRWKKNINNDVSVIVKVLNFKHKILFVFFRLGSFLIRYVKMF